MRRAPSTRRGRRAGHRIPDRYGTPDRSRRWAGGDIDIRTLMESTEVLQTLKFALIVVASVPLMVLYPFQKHFAKGVMIGSIKG